MAEAARDENLEAMETIERFMSIERDHNLFEIRADGIPVWERIRTEISSEILYDVSFRETVEQSNSSGKTFDQFRRDVKNGFGKLLGKVEATVHAPIWAEEADYLFWGRARRSLEPDGTWWDPYCDPLHDRFDYDYVHVERPKGARHLRPAKTDNLYYLDLVDDLAGLRRWANIDSYSLTESEDRAIAGIEDLIENEFGTNFDIRGLVESELTQRRAILPFYDWLLARINPDVAVVTISQTKLPFIEACSNQGIPTVELQHGITGEYHVGYTYPEEVDVRVFPDYFMTFGQYWSDQCTVPLPEDSVRAVGFPYLDIGRERFTDVSAQEKILFISQETVGIELSQVAATLSESPTIDAEIVYKLSWGESNKWESKYPWLVDSGVNVVEDVGTQLYRLFAESTTQVGVYSTAVFEGLAFGLDTYLLNLPGLYMIKGLIDSTAVVCCDSASDLTKAIASEAAGDVDAERFFEPNAHENIKLGLEEIRRVHR